MSGFFGTDGVRGVFGEKITCKLAFDLGHALGVFAKQNGIKHVIAGKDTRPSGDVLLYALISGVAGCGIDVTQLDVVTTPMVSFLSKIHNSLGVMITASHNVSEYNGIKIFKDGLKLNETEEQNLTQIYNTIDTFAFGKAAGKIKKGNVKKYLEFMQELLRDKFFDIKVGFDCANGAGGAFVKKLFTDKFKELRIICASSNGININKSCGAAHPQCIKEFITTHKLDFGFSYDGDCDRIVMADRSGKIYDGDAILFILSNFLLSQNALGKEVTGTILTNSGLERFLNSRGVKLMRTPVGDKYIAEHISKHKLMLGGEPSGHIILGRYALTGDGILTAILLLFAIERCGRDISSLLKGYEPLPQLNENVAYTKKEKEALLNENESDAIDISQLQQKYNKKLSSNGRVIIRKSGTEPVIRIMAECNNKKLAAAIIEEIKKELTQ